MDVHVAYAVFLRPFRRRRMAAFARAFDPGSDTTILDVGGTLHNWEILGVPGRLTLLNLEHPENAGSSLPNVQRVTATGTALAFGDASFDVAFSNSVIEHLGSWERQQAFATELRRVGRGLWVQTPARSFPVEPHLMAPLVHYLPRRWQRVLLRNCTLWGWLSRPSPERVERFLAETRLLGFQQMQRLFPDCEIRRERLLGVTKAYVAVRPMR